MNVLDLAFDTATLNGRFALAEGGRRLADRPVNVTGRYADALLPVVDALLAEAGRGRGEIGAVGVTRGPGSFTGVRIAVATAKTLAYALGARLVAVPTPEAMAAALLAEHPDRELAVPALDARRGEVYAGVYRRRGGWVEPLLGPAALAPDAFFARLAALVPDLEAPAYGGDGVALVVGQGPSLRPELRGRGPVLRSWSSAQPDTARALAAAMGDPAADLPSCDPFLLTPLYLRVSDAERKRKMDLTPEAPDPNIGLPPAGEEGGT